MKRYSFASAAGLFLAFCSPALQANPLETITVTASRTPLSVAETGSSVTVISREEIEASQAATLQDLLRHVPGLAVSQQGSLGAVTQVRMRGAEANQLLVMIDGVEANDVAQSSEFNFAHLLAADIQRVEIVRGPQSSLWGSDALAGVVHVITRADQRPDELQLDSMLEAGSFNTSRASVSAVLPAADGHLRLSADYLSTDGTNISRTGSEKDGYNNFTLALSGQQPVGKNVKVNFSLRQSSSETDFDGVDFFVTGLPQDQPFYTESEMRYGGVEVQHDPNERWQQSFRLSANQTHNQNHNGSPVVEVSRGERLQGQYQINFRHNQHIVSTLLETEKEIFKQRAAASFFGDPNKDLSATSNSVAVEYRFDGNQLDLSVSARQDNNSEFDNAFSWRTTAAWQPGRVGVLYASVGESIKNPTFTERFGYFDTFIGNPDLSPEEALNYELGWRQQWLDDQLLLDISWFSTELDNEINGFVFDAASGGFTADNVTGQSEREGIEVAASYQPGPQFRMDFNYTYLDAEEGTLPGVMVQEVRRPQHTVSLNGRYYWSAASISASVVHTGKQQDDYFPPVPPYQERVNLSGYTLVNMALSYQLTPQLKLTARAQNLTDESYEEVFGFRAPGRSLHAGLRYSF